MPVSHDHYKRCDAMLRDCALEKSQKLTLLCPAAQIESNYDEVTETFDDMQLKSELLRGVYAYGFERPSAIQQRAIMPVIKGEPPKFSAFLYQEAA